MSERRLSRADRIVARDGDRRHGTIGGYTNNRCRCTQCRAAWAAYVRSYRQRNPDQYQKHLERMRAYGQRRREEKRTA